MAHDVHGSKKYFSFQYDISTFFSNFVAEIEMFDASFECWLSEISPKLSEPSNISISFTSKL